MYAATTGTFLQRDPVGYTGDGVLEYSHSAITSILNSRRMGIVDPNLYEYARSNPLKYIDPMGLDAGLFEYGVIEFPDPPPRPKPRPAMTEPNNYRVNGKCTIEGIQLFCSTMSATNHMLGYHCFLAIKKDGQWIEAISGGPGGESGPNDTSRLVFKDYFEDINGLLNKPFWVEQYGKFTTIEAPYFLPGYGCTGNKYCDFYECAVKAAIELHDQYAYNSWHGATGGRNSNWFISQVIKKCGGFATFPATARMGENIPLPPSVTPTPDFWWYYGGIGIPMQ